MSGHLGVVIHVTAGEGDPYNEFANPANQVSSHFGIGNGQGGMGDGHIEQYVDTDLESWAQMGGNPTYVSVETEGLPSDPLTPSQVASFARLYQWLAPQYDIPFVSVDTPGQRGLITHGDGGASWGGHYGCPGIYRSNQREDILRAAQVHPKEDSMNAVVTPDGKVHIYCASPDNHLLDFTRDPNNAAYDSVIDVTAQIGPKNTNNTLFLVQP